MKLKGPWRPFTTSLRAALIVAGCWLLVGMYNFAFYLLKGWIWLGVLWGLYFVCGIPWYVTAIVLLRRRHNVGTEKV